jgi:protein SCO1/2
MILKKWRLRRFVTAAVAMAAVALLLAACGGSSSNDGNSDTPAAASSTAIGNSVEGAGYYGAVPDPILPKPDLTLEDTAGQPFNIAKDTDGKLTLVYLGYTHCPDDCPTFIAQLGNVLKQMPADVTSNIEVIFVTTDPARDTGPVLRKWLDSFDTKFIGLTGTETQIDDISKLLGVPPPEKEDLGNGNYGVSHGSFIYAFDKNDGKAHLIYPEGFSDPDLTADFTKLATKGFQPTNG